MPYVCDASDSLCSYDYKNKAAFKGTETVDGVETNKVCRSDPALEANDAHSQDLKQKRTQPTPPLPFNPPHHQFYWTENLGPIPMNSLMLYTSASSSTPTPVRLFRDIHPFGKALANATLDFENFQVRGRAGGKEALGGSRAAAFISQPLCSSPPLSPPLLCPVPYLGRQQL